MKRVVIMVASFLMLFGLISCSTQESVDISSETNTSAQADTESDSMNLITPEELISTCGLTEADYQGKDLEAFITDFALTEENVTKLNVAALLKNYTDIRNVEDILNKKANKRESDFTKDVVAVAFMENKNTTVNSMYLDVTEKKAWACQYQYVFDNLNRYESEDVVDAVEFAAKMDALNIFALADLDQMSDIKDPASFTIAVEYADGSVFRVTRSGIPSKIQPDNYDEIRKLMFFQS